MRSNIGFAVRPATAEVRGSDGCIHTVTYASCPCGDQIWRDYPSDAGLPHFCKHLRYVYDYPGIEVLSGARFFRMASFTTKGVVYELRLLYCTCDGTGLDADNLFRLCEHVTAAYDQLCPGWYHRAEEYVGEQEVEEQEAPADTEDHAPHPSKVLSLGQQVSRQEAITYLVLYLRYRGAGQTVDASSVHTEIGDDDHIGKTRKWVSDTLRALAAADKGVRCEANRTFLITENIAEVAKAELAKLALAA